MNISLAVGFHCCRMPAVEASIVGAFAGPNAPGSMRRTRLLKRWAVIPANALARHYSLHPQLALRASFAVRSGILPAQSTEGRNPVLLLIYEGKIKNWTPAFAGVTTHSRGVTTYSRWGNGNTLARHYSLHPQLALRASFAVRSGILPAQSSEGWNPVLPLIYEGKIKNWTPAFAGVTAYSRWGGGFSRVSR